MAGKYALYLPYHIITALENEGFSDTDIGTFVRGVIKYHTEGTPPKFEDRSLNLLFSSSKPEFDNNIEKYRNTVLERSEAGKKGGAPRGNQNAAGNRGGGAPKGNRNAVKREAPDQAPEPKPENKHKQMFEFEPEKQTQAKQADIDIELELELELELEKDNSGSSTAAAGGGEVVLEKQPTTTTTAIIFNFQKECEQLGFPITEAKARSLLETGLNPEWLSGPGCFPSFIAAFINEAYQDKAGYERTRLFLKALTWEDKQAEYQAWLGEQQAAAERSRKREETEAGRQRMAALRLETPKPVSCLNCGAGLPPDTDLCPECDHYSRWDDESGAYTAQKRFDFSELKHRIFNDNVSTEDTAQYFREIP